jgi:O-antigen/teichoic acid export membrane protein
MSTAGDRFASLRSFFHKGRGGRVRLAAASGFSIRVVLAAVGFISLPITIHYLGNEGYGLMLAITSAVTWFQISTLGVGAGLQNALTEAIAKDDKPAQTTLVTTACVALGALALILLVLGAAIYPWIEWTKVFPPTTTRFLLELNWAVVVVFACFCANVFLGFVPAVLAARQENHIAFLGQLLGGTASLAMLLVATQFDWGLVGVVATGVGSSAAVGAGLAIWLLYFRGLPALRPRASAFSTAALRRLINRSTGFLILNLSNIAFFQSDMFILTHIAGADAVAPYGVTQRVYAQFAALFGIVTGSLWVAYGEAMALGDVQWIRRTYLRSRRTQAIVVAFVLVFMVVFGEPLLRLWVGPSAAPNVTLIAVLGAVFVAQQWTATHAMMLNGLDVVGPQVACLLINGALLIALSILGAMALGPTGLAIGALLAYAATSCWYLPLLVRRTLHRLEANA